MPIRSKRELTLRALATGMILGAALTPSNVYSGLKIGWSFNMSIIASSASASPRPGRNSGRAFPRSLPVS